MNTTPPPGMKKVTDWVGLTVRTRVVLRNGWAEIAVGTLCKVTYARSGLSLETERCETCGVKVRITRVSPAMVEIEGMIR